MDRIPNFNPFVKHQIPTIYDDTLTYLELLQKVIAFLNQVIDQSNGTIELFNELKEHMYEVVDWLKNEALPDGIAEKINDMYESGELADIINEEVFNMKADKEDLEKLENDFNLFKQEMELFLTVIQEEFERLESDMQESFENLEEEINQNLEDFQTSINQLIEAQNEFLNTELGKMDNRITQLVSINRYNVDPTGEQDSLDGFKQAIENLEDHEVLVLDKNAEYYLSDELRVLRSGKFNIEGNGAHIKTNTRDNRDGIYFGGELIRELTPMTRIESGLNKIRFANVEGLKVGDLLYFTSDDQYNDSRTYYKKGGVFTIGMINRTTNEIWFDGQFPYNINDTLRVYAYDPVQVNIRNLKITGLNTLPAGRFGICIEYSAFSKLENVVSDNFNHCITFRYHYSTVVDHVRTMRAMYQGTRESYGLSIYVGNYTTIRNSHFKSGRHGLEVSGFENSFKTLVENCSIYSENGEFDFNTHQCSHDITLINCTFGTMGLCGFSTLIKCQIGRNVPSVSQLKSSQTLDLSQFLFQECQFTSEHTLRCSMDQNNDNPATRFGEINLQDCFVEDKILITVSLSSHRFTVDKIIVNNTDNVAIIGWYGVTINRVIYENMRYNVPEQQLIRGNNAMVINDVVFKDCNLNSQGISNFIELRNTDKAVFDNTGFGGSNAGSIYVTNESNGVRRGRMYFSNTDLRNIRLYIRGLDTISFSGVQRITIDGESTINNIFKPVYE